MVSGRKYAEDIQPFIEHVHVAVTIRGRRAGSQGEKPKPVKRQKLDNLGSTEGNGDFVWDEDGGWYPVGPDREWAELGACSPHLNGMQSCTPCSTPSPSRSIGGGATWPTRSPPTGAIAAQW